MAMASKGTRIFRRLSLFSAVSLAAASPVTVEGGLRIRTAECQDGTCCPEEKTTCVVGDYKVANYYFKESGSCKTTTEQ